MGNRCCTKCICSCGCAGVVVPTYLWCVNTGCVLVQGEYRDVYMLCAGLQMKIPDYLFMYFKVCGFKKMLPS